MREINHKKLKFFLYLFFERILYLAANLFTAMKGILLNAFYDSIQYHIGWTLTYIFTILLAIELIYVMAKYLGSRTDK